MIETLVRCDECESAYTTIHKVDPIRRCPVCKKDTKHRFAVYSEIPAIEMNSTEEQIAVYSKKARELVEKLTTQLAELSTIRDKVNDLYTHLEDSESDLDNGLSNIASGIGLLDSAVRSLKLIK